MRLDSYAQNYRSLYRSWRFCFGKEWKIVGKSFIAPINGRTSGLPNRCILQPASSLAIRVMAVFTDRFFSENPRTDAEGKTSASFLDALFQ